MKFTLFLNTRKRPALLNSFLFSVLSNTKNKKDIEILIRYDDDDEETEEFSNRASFIYDLNLTFIKGPRPKSLIVSYNETVRRSKGENLFVCNDDIQILTKDWDEIALRKIEEYKKEKGISDDIYLCTTDCSSIDRDKRKGYCSFPIISKKATDVLGFFMYDSFVGLGGDSSIHRLYEGIDRVIDITEIKINHELHSSLEAINNPDQTASDMRKNTRLNFVDPYSFDVSKEVDFLKKYIKEHAKT